MFHLGFHPLEFIVYFIHEMRNQENVRHAPSTRQAIFFIKLLVSQYLRTGKIKIHDIIDLAVNTTYYEDQDIARELAYKILVNMINEDILEGKGVYSIKASLKMLETNLIMEDYFKDPDILQKLLDLNYEEMDWESLTDIIYETKQSGNGLELKDIELMHALGTLEKYKERIQQEGGQLQKILSQYLTGEESWKKQMNELLEKDIEKYGEIASELADSIEDIEEIKDILNQALKKHKQLEKFKKAMDKRKKKKGKKKKGTSEQKRQGCKNKRTEYFDTQEYQNNDMGELKYAEKYMEPPPSEIEKINNALKSVCKDLRDLDEANRSDFLEHFIKNIPESFKENLNIEDYLELYPDNKMGQEEFETNIKETLQSMGRKEKQQLLSKLSKKREALSPSNSDLHSTLSNVMKDVAESILEKEKRPQSFQSILKNMLEDGVPMDMSKMEKMAQNAGISSNQFQKITQKKTEQLNQMIEGNIDDYEKYAQIIQYEAEKWEGGDRFKEITVKGAAKSIPSLLSALANYDLEKTTKFMKQRGYSTQKDIETLIKGLAAGSGSGIIQQWFNARDDIPDVFFEPIQSFTKQRLLDLSLFYAKSHFGFIHNGNILSTNQLRTYRDGDSLENIDIEATLDNLIGQGKRLKYIQPPDILCKKEREQTLKVLILIDTSGSMDGEKMLNASLSSTILLYLLNADDLAILSFASDTYELKKFKENIPLKSLSKTLLSLKAEGGTIITPALEYIITKSKKMDRDQKMVVFIFSDFYYHESHHQIWRFIQKLKAYKLYFFLFSKERPDKENIRFFRKSLNFNSLQIPSPQTLPEVLARTIFEFRG